MRAVLARFHAELEMNPANQGLRNQIDHALQSAVRNTDLPCVELLLNFGANPNFVNANGESAFALAQQFRPGFEAKSLQIFQRLTNS